MKKSLSSGPETPCDCQYDGTPRPQPFPRGFLRPSPPASPLAHSCPLAFLLVPTPALQWGPKLQEAGLCLSASSPCRIMPFHLPCSLARLRCSGSLRPGSPSLSLPSASHTASSLHVFGFPFPGDEESPFCLRVPKVHTRAPSSEGKPGSSPLTSTPLTGYQLQNGYGPGAGLGEEALLSFPFPPSLSPPLPPPAREAKVISDPASSLPGFGGGLRPQKVGEPPGPPYWA